MALFRATTLINWGTKKMKILRITHRAKVAKHHYLEPIKRGLNPKDDPCISNIERVTEIFVGQGITKSHNIKIFRSQYLGEFLRNGPDFFACDHKF